MLYSHYITCFCEFLYLQIFHNKFLALLSMIILIRFFSLILILNNLSLSLSYPKKFILHILIDSYVTLDIKIYTTVEEKKKKT